MPFKERIYRHVVLFQFKADTPEPTVRQIESAFQRLCAELPFVTDFEWGINSSPEKLNEGYTHCFIVTFAQASDRDTYLVHPKHREFCRDHLDPNLFRVCVVDYDARV